MPRTPVDPRFLRTLTLLRWVAVAGQSLAILAATRGLGVPLAQAPLWAGVAALAVFNLIASLRPPAAPVTTLHALAHLAADIAQLTLVVGLSGGATNPFVSLFLVPIALATLALPVRAILVVAAMATLGYALAAWLGPSLPHVHGLAGLFDLHLAGMAVNFLLTAVVFVSVLTRLAALRDERERELASLRERQARDEGILGLATHAAAMAHSLNTPLATLTLLLDDLAEDLSPQPALRGEAVRAQELVAVCRDQVRELARAADPGRQRVLALADWVDELVARWELLRPEIQLDRRIGLPLVVVRADPAVAHLLQALLDNAADASRERGRERVRLELSLDADALVGAIADEGSGAPGDVRTPGWRRSDKAHGLGVGLALSHATVERLGGRLELKTGSDGSVARFRLPLASLRAGLEDA